MCSIETRTIKFVCFQKIENIYNEGKRVCFKLLIFLLKTDVLYRASLFFLFLIIRWWSRVEWSQGVRGEKATLTLEEDGTFTYTYWASDSADADKTVMSITATGTYTKDGDNVEVALEDVEGYAMNGDSKVDMSSETGYSLTYSQGSTKFQLDGNTFIPVE